MEASQLDLTGLIDIHVHAAPDVRERAFTDLELARAAETHGVAGVVLKSHVVPTVDRAWLLNRITTGPRFYGGIALNPPVGGLNPHAVETVCRLGARIVWLPTLWSSRQRGMEGHDDGIAAVVDGGVVPALAEVLQVIARHDVVLATGHLVSDDVFVVVEAAVRAGVERIVVNHPEHDVVAMSVEEQRRLAAHHPVFFERVFSQPDPGGGQRKNLAVNLAAIEALGPETTIIATDAGQVGNPFWSDMLAEYLAYLADRGVSPAAIRQMTRTNPAALLGG